MVDHFGIDLDYTYVMYGLIPGKGHMHFELEKTYLYVVLKLGATDKGHFYPEIHDMHMSVGSEKININDSFLMTFVYNQFANVFKYIL